MQLESDRRTFYSRRTTLCVTSFLDVYGLDLDRGSVLSIGYVGCERERALKGRTGQGMRGRNLPYQRRKRATRWCSKRQQECGSGRKKSKKFPIVSAAPLIANI